MDKYSKTFRHKVGQELFRFTAFITTVVFYFVFVDDDGDVLLTTPLKCAPILSLALFVYLKGIKIIEEHKYSHYVFTGLIFSCVGDFFLNVDLFPFGMVAFWFAQIFYVRALGLSPVSWETGLPIFIAGTAMTSYVFPNLNTVMQIGLPCYAFMLCTMCWRSIVRMLDRRDFFSKCCGIGSIFFVISDTLICVDMFISPIKYSRLLIMTTYYTAQFLIALSTLCDTWKPKKPKGSARLSRRFRNQN